MITLVIVLHVRYAASTTKQQRRSNTAKKKSGTQKYNNMDIKVLEGEVNHYKESNTIHVLAFGRIKENSVAKVKIKVEGVSESTLASTCGCSSIASDEKDVYVIHYKNTNIVKPFSKVIILDYVENGNKEQRQIKITGTVIQ